MKWLKIIGAILGAIFPFIGGRDADKVKKLALPVLEAINKLDVDAGRSFLVDELLQTAKTLGVTWLSDLALGVEELTAMNRHDFRMWLACARIGLNVARDLGFDKLPELDLLRSIATGLYSVGVKRS